MFKVKDGYGRIYIVYAVEYRKEYNDALFLIYKENYGWRWDKAEQYKPIVPEGQA